MQQKSLDRSALHDALVKRVVVGGRSVGLLLESLLHDGDGHAYSLVDGDQAILAAAAGARQPPGDARLHARATGTLVDELENRALSSAWHRRCLQAIAIARRALGRRPSALKCMERVRRGDHRDMPKRPPARARGTGTKLWKRQRWSVERSLGERPETGRSVRYELDVCRAAKSRIMPADNPACGGLIAPRWSAAGTRASSASRSAGKSEIERSRPMKSSRSPVNTRAGASMLPTSSGDSPA